MKVIYLSKKYLADLKRDSFVFIEYSDENKIIKMLIKRYYIQKRLEICSTKQMNLI